MKNTSNKLVCMLRVKDGILFVERWLLNIEKLVDEIVVVDNGSTDGTLEILKRSPKVVSINQTEGFDEGRDKILVYNRAKERNADWILWLDVDEILEERLDREKLEKMMNSKSITKYWFRRFHLHKDEHHFEASFEKIFQISSPDRILWKDQASGYFNNDKIHNGLIRGITGWDKVSHFRIKHFGALNKEYLEKKTELYTSIDPGRTDMYIKHRDQQLNTWKWFEYRQRPILVTSQNLILDFLFAIKLMLKKIGLLGR